MKKTIKEIECHGKRALVRVDFNVPLEEGRVADDGRIRAALPTIEYLRKEKARIILCSHLGRPKGKVAEEFRLNPVAERLSELLGIDVVKVDDCIGPEVKAAADSLKPGDILLLENTRFHPEEEANDPGFSTELASTADIFVNDAFGAAHRAHASTEGVAHHLPAVAGLLMELELNVLERVRDDPAHPFAVILGGAKISDKIGTIKQFLKQADIVLVGGGIANTLLKARGKEVGKSLVEEESLDTAGDILDQGAQRLILPVDAVVARSITTGSEHQTVSVENIPTEWRIVDIGPKTVELFKQTLEPAKTVLWNGPLGLFEIADFAEGTFAVARELAELDATTIVGGGDSAAAIAQANVAERITHVSSGGGAFLAFMEKGSLPCVDALEDA